ncbi:MAG: response regulator transcription factor [Flavobacteriales bacterium]|jgi:DNA-binding NarL/FixJ family response regulator|nr:response regulator transcription factor [Flavobacteriales bacterium]MCB0757806.1 response regulator transcription factor [Flavobacteriales bacterium]
MEPETPIRLVLCDDHCIITDGLQRMLRDEPWVDCVGTAPSGEEALFLLEHIAADIVLLDLNMPGMDGIEVMQRIRERWPEMKIIILTMNDEPAVVRRLLDQGAHGYLLKTCGRDELLRAVQAVHEGNKHFSADVTEALLKQRTETAAHDGRLTLLSPREREVLGALAEGLSNKEIGKRLFISSRTVDTHRTNLMKKLGMHNLAGLVRLAVSAGLVR